MITTDFDQFCGYILLEIRNRVVQQVFQRIMLHMNEHNIHGLVVSILRFK